MDRYKLLLARDTRARRLARGTSFVALGALAFASLGAGEGSPEMEVAAEAASRVVGTLAAGSRWETPYHILDSGLEGPKVMLVAGMHGDEPAPPLAADEILGWPIRSGRLIVVPRASRPALAARQRVTHDAQHPNLNRNFPREGQDSAQGAMAEALWRLVHQERPEWLVDMHEGTGYHRAGDKSVGSSIIRSRSERVHASSEILLARINETIVNPEHHFDLLGPPVAGSLARAARERLGIHSLIVETSRPEPLMRRVLQHQLLVRTLLVELDMLDDDPELMAAL